MIGFAFFGTVSLRGKSNTYPKLVVELQFNHYGECFLIKRKINDAILLMYDKSTSKFTEVANSTTGVNNKIIALLGYDYNIYLLSNYCQQGKLQYFSELTPAKRLAFIDKVSGIEDAKDLVTWLSEKRKNLKVTLETLREMLHEPSLSEGIDMDYDYDLEIDSLDTEGTELNTVMSELKNLQRTLKNVPYKLKSPDDTTLLLTTLSEDAVVSYKEQFNLYEGYKEQLEQATILRNSILDKCPRSMRGSTLSTADATLLLNKVMINSLSDTVITCPSCTHVFSTEVLKTKPHSCSYSVKDLSNYIDWSSEENQSTLEATNKLIKGLTESIQNLLEDKDFAKVHSMYKSANGLLQAIQVACKSLTDYTLGSAERDLIIKDNLVVTSQVNILQERTESLLKDQVRISNLKSELVAKRVEKALYIKQLVLYEEAVQRFTQAKTEFDLVQNLIKQCNEITTKIKLETIPLINYHASAYLNTMTKGVMTDIKITDTYDLIVDDFQINLRSGAQKDLSSLAFRLSLGQSIILGMMPLFIGDEIDASSPTEVANDITESLETMSNNGYQIILITHKDISNLENCNIINLG